MPADDLKKTLERRAAVIQRALRSGKVGGRKLDQLLLNPTWRADLDDAIKVAATKAEAQQPFGAPETARPPFTDITDEPTTSWTPRQLLTQYIITRLNPRDSAGLQKEILEIHEEILQIYNAFGLELLAGRQLRGRSAGESLIRSLAATRIAEERIRPLSAFQELYRLLSTTAERGRRTILLRF